MCLFSIHELIVLYLLAAGQTFEGGISGKPQSEAHGSYAFCALACLCILGPPQEMLPRCFELICHIPHLLANVVKVP